MLLGPVRKVGFCYAYGREVVGIRGTATDRQIRNGKPSRDSFVLAITPQWWAQHGTEIPDSSLTSIGLDESLRRAIETIKPVTSPLADLVYHSFRF